MDSDWLQFAAYAIIIIIMGVSAIIKKVAEAQRRRQLLGGEEHRQMMTAQQKRGLTAEDENTHAEIKQPVQEEIKPSPPEIQEIDLEEVLRRALGFPAHETEKERYKRRLEKARPQQSKVTKTPALPSASVSRSPLPIEPAEKQGLPVALDEKVNTGWADFTRRLSIEQPDELSRAVILSEIIAPPVSFRGRSGGIGRRVRLKI